MTDEQARPVGRPFRHFKGNLYRLGEGVKDSETLERISVRRVHCGGGGLGVRLHAG